MYANSLTVLYNLVQKLIPSLNEFPNEKKQDLLSLLGDRSCDKVMIMINLTFGLPASVVLLNKDTDTTVSFSAHNKLDL